MKAIKFLSDGHVMFCVGTKENFGPAGRSNRIQKAILESLQQHTSSGGKCDSKVITGSSRTIGFIGHFLSPPISNFAEFIYQAELHNSGQSHKHQWFTQEGTLEGKEMTMVEWMELITDQRQHRAGMVLAFTDYEVLARFEDDPDKTTFLFKYEEKVQWDREQNYFKTFD